MNYTEALEYIHGVDKFGMILGLDSIRELLRRLGNPEKNLNIIHIAGTNGKGSTASFVSSVLIESGYKTGLYTSPFLERFNERIRINGEEIDNQRLADCVEKVKEKAEEMAKEGLQHPTEFEIVTATAFYFYNEEKVDALVLEVGLGGRFDATNVVDKTIVSLIASISKDHTKVLGDTLEEIAYEKAGIIKDEGKVFLYGQEESVEKVIEEVCLKKNADLIKTDNVSIKIKKANLNNQIFDCIDYLGNKHEDIKIRMLGEHQVKNALLAINALIYLKENSIFNRITEQSMREGFLKTKWAGRMEIVSEKPLFIIDGAHNVDAAQLLSKEIDKYFGEEWDKTLILGVLEDKDVDSIVKTLVPKFNRIIITLPDNPRAMEVGDLAFRVGMYSDDIICIENIDESVEYAYSLIEQLSIEEKKIKNEKNGKKSSKKKVAKKENKVKKKVIVAAGSLYLVGHIRSHIKSKNI